MAQHASNNNQPSAVDRLRGALTDYATSKVGSAAEGLGQRLTRTTRRLTGDPDGQDNSSPGGSDTRNGQVTPGDAKVTTVIETLDVGVPLRTAYDHWTCYEEFGQFAKGVQEVSKEDETASSWTTKIALSTRSFEATVVEQIPDDRIVWTSKGAKGSTQGAVSFHELTPTLTRVVLVVEYRPAGFFEKTGNIWRAQGRRIRLDFKHFQRYVTLAEEDPEGWRGEIRDGEVVRTDEEVRAEEDTDEEDTDEDDADEEAEAEADENEDEDER